MFSSLCMQSIITFLTFWHFNIADKILGTLGEGTFGKVVKVKDMEM